MNILILNSLLYTTEGNKIHKVDSIKECMIYTIALGFKSLGHDVTLIAGEEFKPTEKGDYEIDIIFQKSYLKKIFIPKLLPLQLSLIPYLIKNGKKFDLILSSEVFSFCSLFSVIFQNKKTLIWQELNLHNHKFKKIPSVLWYNLIGRSFFRNTLIAARSESARKFISQYCKNVSSTIVDHGVNLQKFRPSDKVEKQFIIAARLVKGKSIDYMIEQFAKLIEQPDYQDYKLLIAGNGEEEDSLKNLVSELKIGDSVMFLGFLNHNELNQHTAHSIAFLVHTKKDLNMVSIPESIVSGTPILTNKLPALASYIERQELGIVCDNWGPKELEMMVQNHSRFSQNCLKNRDDLSSTNSAIKLIDVFKSTK